MMPVHHHHHRRRARQRVAIDDRDAVEVAREYFGVVFTAALLSSDQYPRGGILRGRPDTGLERVVLTGDELPYASTGGWPDELDFVEVPSTMLEEFIQQPAVLRRGTVELVDADPQAGVMLLEREDEPRDRDDGDMSAFDFAQSLCNCTGGCPPWPGTICAKSYQDLATRTQLRSHAVTPMLSMQPSSSALARRCPLNQGILK